jgi:hypothetical protein
VQCEVAKELLAKETPDVQVKIGQELDAMHNSLVAEYQEGMKGEPSTDPADQKLYVNSSAEMAMAHIILYSTRDMLAEVVQPFIDGIHAYTGLTICLLGGAPPKTSTDKYELFM